MTIEIRKALTSIDLFAALSPAALDRLAEFSKIRRMRAGETIFCQGEPSPSCFGVISGEVVIQRVSRNRRYPAKVLSVLGPGEIFGESALFKDSPRTAMASANRDGQILVINGFEFRAWIQRETAAGGPLLMGLVDQSLNRLRQTSNELSVIHGIGRLLATSKPIEQRLSAALDFLVDSLDGINEIILFQRSPYWEEFQPVASIPEVVGIKALPFDCSLVRRAHGASEAVSLYSAEDRQIVLETKLPWENFAAMGLVPILDRDQATPVLQGIMLLASYENSQAFSANTLLLFSAVSYQIADSMARHYRQQDILAQTRLYQSRTSFQI